MTRRLRLAIFAASLLFVSATLAAPATAPAPSPVPKAKPAPVPVQAQAPKPEGPPPLFCDMAVYPPLKLAWSQNADLKQVVSVFPHPLLPQRAVEATQTGLFFSDDAGVTWKALPEGNAEKVGVIKKVAFHPTQVDAFYLASQSKGVWITNDNGKTFIQVGSKANGMASDTSVDLIVYPADSSHRTLLAVHGEAASGYSRSLDAGKTWDVLNTAYSFKRILAHEKDSAELILYGWTKEEHDVKNLYFCSTPGEFAVEFMHDIQFTDMTFVPSPGLSPLYVTTSDAGLYRIDGHEHDSRTLGVKDMNWAGVAPAWGPNADVLNLCLYNPSKLGLVLSKNNLAGSQTVPGVPVGPLIKEGSFICPNANGTVFYAVINNQLSIGRVDETVPVVSITPAVVESSRDDSEVLNNLEVVLREFNRATQISAATESKNLYQHIGDLAAPYRRLQLTITARLPLKPSPPTSVTVDLSRYGGVPDSPLFDDGRHDDGAAGDGVYGLTFCFQPMIFAPYRRNDWRPDYPGQIPLGVTAVFADGHRQGAVGVVGVYPRLKSYYFWWYGWNDPEKEAKNIHLDTQGAVTVKALPNPPGYKFKRSAYTLCLEAQSGTWSATMAVPYMMDNFSSHQAISFWIKAANGQPPKGLYIQLQDKPGLAAPVTTERFPVSSGIHEGGISTDYRRAILNFKDLLGKNDPPLETDRVGKIIICGEGDAPSTLYINDFQILSWSQESNPSDQPPSP